MWPWLLRVMRQLIYMATCAKSPPVPLVSRITLIVVLRFALLLLPLPYVFCYHLVAFVAELPESEGKKARPQTLKLMASH